MGRKPGVDDTEFMLEITYAEFHISGAFKIRRKAKKLCIPFLCCVMIGCKKIECCQSL